MPPPQNYRKSMGKEVEVECRICSKILKFQNYQTHLKSQHPHEDHKNLRTKTNKSIKDMFSIKSSSLKKPSPFLNDENTKKLSLSSADILDQNQNIAKSPLSSTALAASGPGDDRAVALESEHLDIGASSSNKASISEVVLSGDSSGEYSTVIQTIDDNPGENDDIVHDTNIENKDDSEEFEKVSVEDLNNLVVKLAPLAKLESDVITKLVDNIEALAKLSILGQEEQKREDKKVDTASAKPEDFDLNALFFSCHSVNDLAAKFQEFEYDAGIGGFVCCVCNSQGSEIKSSVFTYDCDLESDFTNKVQSKKFGNLKTNLKNHLKTMAHIKALEEATNKANIEYKEDSRNKAVALKICRMAYYLLKAGRPDTDFTTLIYLHSVNGCDVGDINHSFNFVPQFLKHVAQVIEDRLKRFLCTRTVQTGFKPPVKIVADKATWQHQTRQIIGIVTVIGDADQPLQAMVLGSPVVKSHNGRGVTDNITSVTDQFVSGDQYKGGSFDGQYFHLKVDKMLDDHYGVTSHHDVDPMHRAGTVDLHLRKEKASAWIVNLTLQVGKAFKVVNYGKLFEHFFEVCQELSKLDYDINFKFPRFYSETKFANYVRLVYCSFREDYAGLTRTFREAIERLKVGSTEDKNKAKEITNILGKILNLKFVIELSGACDIYNRFGHGVNILQTVNMLPHVKYDKFVDTVTAVFSTMAETVDPKLCPCEQNVSSDKCVWPLLDLREVATKSTYRGVTVGNLMANELSTRAGTRREKENLLLDQAGVLQKCFDELKTYSTLLGSNLFAKVYDAADKKLINSIRIVLDLETLAIKVKLSGSAHVAALRSKLFIEKAREISPPISDISDEELRLQYRDFLRKLETIIEDTDESELKSMEIFRSFLSTKHKLYLNVEMVIQVLCDAATSMSVESVVESWVSIYEAHSNKHRPISNERAENEICVAVNGPLLQHADPILKEALKMMYKTSKDTRDRGGRFIRRNKNITDYDVSKSVDSFSKKPNSKPFMS